MENQDNGTNGTQKEYVKENHSNRDEKIQDRGNSNQEPAN